MKKLVHLMIVLGITGVLIFPSPVKTNGLENNLSNNPMNVVPSGDLSKFGAGITCGLKQQGNNLYLPTAAEGNAPLLLNQDWPFKGGFKQPENPDLSFIPLRITTRHGSFLCRDSLGKYKMAANLFRRSCCVKSY